MADEPTKEDAPQEPITLEPGTPEYDAAMAARFDEQTPPDSDEGETFIAEKPEGGHDKFYDAKTGSYNWEAHAREVEFRAKGGKPAEPQDGSPSIGDSPEADEGAKDIVAAAGLTMEDLGASIRAEGALTDEQTAALVAQGVPKEMVDDYVSMAKTRMDTNTQAVYEAAGGEESWVEMERWAAANVSEGEKTRLNEMLASGEGELAVSILQQRMAKASPTAGEGKITVPDSTGPTSSIPYESRAQMTTDMNDPKYRSDPAFRRLVHQRVAVSDFNSAAYAG